ncbi:hypothetical protein GCM10010405_36380 [Streptomyces macrosporus]|uniref:Uncharacterized protein n=1 Tax=Streptomyces macrosporus TaxID=44032 RepID=A0ABN3K5U0_9ACTN
MPPPEAGDDILGGSLRVRRVGRHAPKALTVDLDKATAAHESTVGALIAHLGGRGIDVRTYARTPGMLRDLTLVGHAAQRSSSPRSRA